MSMNTIVYEQNDHQDFALTEHDILNSDADEVLYIDFNGVIQDVTRQNTR